MKIYDENLENEIRNPDLEKGRLESAKRLFAHHDEQKRVVHYEVMEGTITSACPEGLRKEVVDKPYRAAWDEFEDVQRYVPYTQDELDKISAAKKAEEEKKATEEAKRLEEEKAAKEREEAEKAAADAKKKQEAANAEKLARIDVIDAQVTYTALMTDTLIGDDSDTDTKTEE